MSEQMREEFERTNGRDHRRQPPKGNNYIDPMAQADWESFQKGWVQSRAAVVVELPALHTLAPDDDRKWHGCRNSTIRTCARAIELAGLKVAP
ncbi:hypothetical protein [Pseudomonas corrugata]